MAMFSRQVGPSFVGWVGAAQPTEVEWGSWVAAPTHPTKTYRLNHLSLEIGLRDVAVPVDDQSIIRENLVVRFASPF